MLKYPWAADVFGHDRLAQARERPGIRHFEGPRENKPWHWGYRRADGALYTSHRRETPWPTFTPLARPRDPMRRLAGAVWRRLG
jgi:hypothetical protein